MWYLSKECYLYYHMDIQYAVWADSALEITWTTFSCLGPPYALKNYTWKQECNLIKTQEVTKTWTVWYEASDTLLGFYFSIIQKIEIKTVPKIKGKKKGKRKWKHDWRKPKLGIV